MTLTSSLHQKGNHVSNNKSLGKPLFGDERVVFTVGDQDDATKHHVDTRCIKGGCDQQKNRLQRVNGDGPIWRLFCGNGSLHGCGLAFGHWIRFFRNACVRTPIYPITSTLQYVSLMRRTMCFFLCGGKLTSTAKNERDEDPCPSTHHLVKMYECGEEEQNNKNGSRCH